MSERQAVSKAMARRYRSATKGEKAVMLAELCALTGWHRDHARRASRLALTAAPARPVPASPPAGVRRGRAGPAVRRVDGARRPRGQAAAPVHHLRQERVAADIAPSRAAVASSRSSSPHARNRIDRRLAADRRRLALRGRSGTKPGSLLKGQIPIRTWADWDDAEPGFVEVDLVGHEGGNPRGGSTFGYHNVPCERGRS